MNNQKFLFLFDAVLMNASNRQGHLLCQALKRGYISAPTAMTLWSDHNINCSLKDLNEAYGDYLSTVSPDPVDDQLDRQQMADLEPPGEFEEDPMNPCGALDPRFSHKEE